MSEFDELKRLTEAADKSDVWFERLGLMPFFGEDDASFIAAANPATILALIARLEAAEALNKRLSDRLDSLLGTPCQQARFEAVKAELAQEKRRLDWALKHGSVMGKVMLTWFSGTGEPSTKITNAEHVRATIDELMGE